MIETLHEIFPNQLIFLGFWAVTVLGLLIALYLAINGKNTSKLIKLASDYFEDRRTSAKQDYNSLFKLVVKLQNELDHEKLRNDDLQDQLDKERGIIEDLTSKLNKYAQKSRSTQD